MSDSEIKTGQQGPETGKVGPGKLVLVVGPSGAGKDTLMSGVRQHLKGRKDCIFARRMITRAADGQTEDHDSLSPEGFRDLTARGDVGLAWEAHGLGYVIPRIYDDHIRAGRTVIANGSRRALPKAFDKYENVTVLLITAPLKVLAERLAARGRETREDIEKRLARADLDLAGIHQIVRIENTGTIEEGAQAILKALQL